MVVNKLDHRPQRSGFTLIDLTVTILVIGILAAVTAPRFANSMGYFRVESAAERLAADIRMARRYAIDKSSPQRLRFSSAYNAYALLDMADPDNPGGWYLVWLAQYPYDTEITSLSFSAGRTLIFDIHGQCNFSGKIVVASGASSRTVGFAAETGEVIVQ